MSCRVGKGVEGLGRGGEGEGKMYKYIVLYVNIRSTLSKLL